jgi:hypothetical protein
MGALISKFTSIPENSLTNLFPYGTVLYEIYAGIAQLVERCLAKAKVAGSNPVSRSNYIINIIDAPSDLVIKGTYEITHGRSFFD